MKGMLNILTDTYKPDNFHRDHRSAILLRDKNGGTLKKYFLGLAFLFILIPSGLTSQASVLWWIKINDTVGGHDSLVYGNHPLATYCIDTGLGENASPPDPPEGFNAVFLSIPGRANCFTTLGIIKKDLRALVPGGNDTFYVQFKNIDSIAQEPDVHVVLRWSSLQSLGCRSDSMFLVDPSHSILPDRIDMLKKDSVVLERVYDPTGPNSSAPLFRFFIYVYGVQVYVCDPGPAEFYTGEASDISDSSATLNGRAYGNCEILDSVRFRYGITQSYGSEISATRGLGDSYFAYLRGLKPSTIYHFQIVPYLSEYCCKSCSFPGYGQDSTFTTSVLSVEEIRSDRPREFALSQNVPNPFNPSTTIGYTLPTSGHVLLKVFDLLGREVATLVDERKEPGEHSATWNADHMPGGVYFYRLQAGRFVDVKKSVVMR